MKQSLLLLIAPVLLCLVGCGSSNNSSNVTIISHASDGLDLKAVTDIALKSKNAEEFEKKLNTSNNKINNLDLDEDNKIDYIKVTEINQPKVKGFSLTVELAGNQEQEICTIQIEKDGDHARAQTHGNRHIYGHHHYYHRRAPLGSSLIWGYMSSNHPPHRSRWGRGSYPSHFSESAPVSKASYSEYHSSQPYAKEVQRKGVSQMTTPMLSPNRNKTASNIKAPLRNPSTSQRAFQSNNPSKNVSRYGSSSSSRVGSSSSWGSSSRSGSSFGSGK